MQNWCHSLCLHRRFSLNPSLCSIFPVKQETIQRTHMDPAYRAQSRTRQQTASHLCFEKKCKRSTKRHRHKPIKDKRWQKTWRGSMDLKMASGKRRSIKKHHQQIESRGFTLSSYQLITSGCAWARASMTEILCERDMLSFNIYFISF